jgi:hypothetical protein
MITQGKVINSWVLAHIAGRIGPDLDPEDRGKRLILKF